MPKAKPQGELAAGQEKAAWAVAQGGFTAQPLAALPPYGCGVPLAGASPEHFNPPGIQKKKHLPKAGASFFGAADQI